MEFMFGDLKKRSLKSIARPSGITHKLVPSSSQKLYPKSEYYGFGKLKN